jgi:hypothetical protein
MLNLDMFVEAIHGAVIKANGMLMDTNVELLDKYFFESTTKKGKTLVPKTVSLEYPYTTQAGDIATTTVQVPMITLVPLTTSKIEKATISVEFDVEVIEEKVRLNFASQQPEARKGKIEIVISPQETSEGLKAIVQGYESMLKRQIS